MSSQINGSARADSEASYLATSTGALVMEDGMIIREGNPPEAKRTKSA